LYKIIEIYFLEKQFKVDVKKIDINVLLNIVAICNAFVFTFVLIVTTFIDNLIIRQLATFVLLFPVIYIAYYIVSVYLKKKK